MLGSSLHDGEEKGPPADHQKQLDKAGDVALEFRAGVDKQEAYNRSTNESLLDRGINGMYLGLSIIG